MQLLPLIVILCCISHGDGAKILGVFAMCAHSHFTLGFRLMKELADRGHDVTFINTFPQKTPIRNLKEISVAENCESLKDLKNNLFEMGRMSYIGQLGYVNDMGLLYTETTLMNKEVQQLLASNETFDLVILENFANEAFAIFPHKFKCPFVWLAPGPTTIFNNHFVGNPSPSAYVPNLLSEFGARMKFWERMYNALLDTIGEIYVHWKMIPSQNDLLRRIIPDAPQLNDILYNASLMLTTSDISMRDPVPLQQNIKEIGGYHVGPIKPLPTEIKHFLDNATEDAIVFTMGSNLKSADFSEDKKRAILKGFSKIKQKVIWKFEVDLPEKPANVKIMKWLPQQDILAHPNIVAFISHVGLLGAIEAVYHGVPILGLPVFWDQTKNIEDAARKGFGVKLSYEDVTEETFVAALDEILNNPKYLKNAKMRSSVMHDQPMKQMDEAVFWIEYVIRHKGASYLKSPGTDLKWYQRYLVDISVFILLSLILIIFVIKSILNSVLRNGKESSLNDIKKNK